MNDDDDAEDRRAILERRAALLAIALSAVAACGESEPQRSRPTVCLSASHPITATPPSSSADAGASAAPQACLSFGCPEGTEPVPGAPSMLTSRAQQNDPNVCRPKKQP